MLSRGGASKSGYESRASERKLWVCSDAAIVLALLAAALLTYLFYAGQHGKDSSRVCEIIYNGRSVLTVPMDKDNVFTIDELPNVEFEVKYGGIAFIHSDCPDKVCVLTGYLRDPGQTAACLPNRVSIRVKPGAGEDSPDVVI